ncbi:hypothetical protein ZWY2020_006138 [Hordeum vulgare]|nr:hypothetical protein ZWY2020_006138 [Hordeum vulgare]
MDRAFRALTVELYATRARLYDALTELQPSHCPRVPPLRIREPSRTELPSALEWTDVGGRTPALGPQLLDWMRYRHQSHNGTVVLSLPSITAYRGFVLSGVDVALSLHLVVVLFTACCKAA